MELNIRTARLRWLVLGAVACASTVLGLTLASAGATAHTATSAASPCSSSDTLVWFGLGEGGGTAGTIYYPLEFSNIGRHTCTLFGYPGVSAYGRTVRQIGPAAGRIVRAHRTIVLRPHATAHALLGIRDSGALCSHAARAAGLRVYPPGQRDPQQVPFAFSACAHRGVLIVGPMRRDTGIPGESGP